MRQFLSRSLADLRELRIFMVLSVPGRNVEARTLCEATGGCQHQKSYYRMVLSMTLPMLPFHHVQGSPSSRVILVCDHASAAIPAPLGGLGLCPADLVSHIAWDIGAATVTALLAEALGASAVLAGVSRLVVDCNRPSEHPGWIPEVTCGIPVPGNRGLSDGDIDARERCWYRPYHQAISETVARAVDQSGPPVVLAIHSFTPCLNGQDRPWHAGLLWNRDPRLAQPMLQRLTAVPGMNVGDNQPYSGRGLNHTLDMHAQKKGYAHLSIEIRQDLIADAGGVTSWATLLAEVLGGILTDERLYIPKLY